jgi:hypothetical protein
MDYSELSERIDRAIAASPELVLIKALEGVGACTYAHHLPLYVRARIRLSRLDSWYYQGWRPQPQISRSPDEERNHLLEQIYYHHREMYHQPCLLCDICQLRKKQWTIAPFSPFGNALTKRSRRQVVKSSIESSDTMSKPSETADPN